MNLPRLLLFGAPLVWTGILAAQPAPLPYLDPERPLAERIDDLLSRLTLEEKASLTQNTTPGVPRLSIPKYDWWNEALHGVARAGHATVFPQAIGLAATWDEPLLHEIGTTIGLEGRAKFNAVAGTPKAGTRYYGLTFWSPNVNIFRDPRWGRGQETYGEDPFLTARLGVAFVRGIQGEDPHYLQAAACAKHFAVHSGPESLRHNFDAVPPEADLYETYLPAFEALVREARVESVMTAYNALNGTPCVISPFLHGLLRQWDFGGHVTSDCQAIGDLHQTYKVVSDHAAAEAVAFRAGLNVRCGREPTAVVEAVKRGLITEREIDLSLAGLLRTQFRLGFFDPADRVPFNRIPAATNDSPAHAAIALRAAHESIVLLKNDGTLPLDPAKLKRLAVVGPNADSLPALLGNYYGTPSAPVKILAGLRTALTPQVQIVYARGCDYADLPPGRRLLPRTALRVDETTGLNAVYFNNPDLAGSPVAQRLERNMRMTFEPTKLPAGVDPANFSARWQGSLLTTQSGDYALTLAGRGGFRLYVDDRLVIDAWDRIEQSHTAALPALPENALVPLRLEFRPAAEAAALTVEWTTPAADAGFADALAAARDADAVVFVGGLTAWLEGEEQEVDYLGFAGGDRLTIELPALQIRLLESLCALGKPVVVVNMSGSAVALGPLEDRLAAVVQAWYPGQAAGTAVADVLFGRVNPSGRLPVTFYRSTADLPDFSEYAMAGRTYRYFTGQPLYAFGHGLSYTTFRYANLRAAPSDDRTIRVSVEVTNTGGRDGSEVVQIYVRPPAGRELRALGAFSRIELSRGATTTVELTVPASALGRWDAARGSYAVPAGEWRVEAAASAADIRATALVTLPGS